MAQPTRCDGQADRRRLSHQNLRRETNGKESQGREEESREEAVSIRPSSGVLTMSTPFFIQVRRRFELLLSRCMTTRASPRSETASTRADVPGGRVRRATVWIAIQTTERGD